MKVIGGLLAADDEKPGLLQEYNELADSFGLLTSFYNISESDVGVFREHGYQVTKWGEEPFVDLQECTWSGKPYEWVRRQTNFCRRAGITIVEHRREEMDDQSWTALIQELRIVSDSLLATKPQSGEIQLVEGQLEVAGWGRRRLFVAYSQEPDSRVEGFLIALPMFGGRSYSFEMYRHRPDAVRGVVPHLFHEVMIRMKAEGVQSVSLCLIPGLGCESDPRRQCADPSRVVLRQEAAQFPVRLRGAVSLQESFSSPLRKSLASAPAPVPRHSRRSRCSA